MNLPRPAPEQSSTTIGYSVTQGYHGTEYLTIYDVRSSRVRKMVLLK